jgi:hypothetical protein
MWVVGMGICGLGMGIENETNGKPMGTYMDEISHSAGSSVICSQLCSSSSSI